MSDKASIIVRLNVKDGGVSSLPSSEQEETCFKGFIVNHYRGFDPDGLVQRAAYGIRFLIRNIDSLRFIGSLRENDETYQEIRRIFDVDFAHGYINYSMDGVSDTKRLYRDGKIEKKDLNQELFWCDADFGQLLIDITGTTQEPVIRYAFINNTVDFATEDAKIWDVDAYLKKYVQEFRSDKGNEQMEPPLASALEVFHTSAVFMTDEQIGEFISTPVYDYLFWLEIEKERKRKEWEATHPVVSGLTYHFLHKAGIWTVEQMLALSDEDLRRIVPAQKNYEEIASELDRLRKK